MVRKRFCLTVVACLVVFMTLIYGGRVVADDAPPEPDAEPKDIQFVLKPTYKIGEKIEFKIHNNSEVVYAYNQKYPACDLAYFDSSEREFIIPPATHCDMVITVNIKPGETKKLFEWDQSECVLDQFGCSKREPLPAGTYTIRGTFYSYLDQDHSTEAVATIELVK